MSFSFSIRVCLWTFIISSILIHYDFDGNLYNYIGTNKPIFVDPELVPFYERFKEFERISGKEVSHKHIFMVISDGFTKDDDTAAYCGVSNHFNRFIVVNRKYFSQASNASKEILFFHEALHCLYYREHKAYSIMESRVLFDDLYKRNYDYFIKEAFGIESTVLKFQYKPYPNEDKQTKDVSDVKKPISFTDIIPNFSIPDSE